MSRGYRGTVGQRLTVNAMIMGSVLKSVNDAIHINEIFSPVYFTIDMESTTRLKSLNCRWFRWFDNSGWNNLKAIQTRRLWHLSQLAGVNCFISSLKMYAALSSATKYSIYKKIYVVQENGVFQHYVPPAYSAICSIK